MRQTEWYTRDIQEKNIHLNLLYPCYQPFFLKILFSMVGRCYYVDMCSQKSLSKEGKWPGVALPAREIHFRDWKSILRLPNHCQLWPTPRFYCKGGEEGVCSYWILTGNTEEGAPERPMHSYRPRKTQECNPSAGKLLKQIFDEQQCCNKHIVFC